MLNNTHYYTDEDGENVNIRQEIDEADSGGGLVLTVTEIRVDVRDGLKLNKTVAEIIAAASMGYVGIEIINHSTGVHYFYNLVGYGFMNDTYLFAFASNAEVEIKGIAFEAASENDYPIYLEGK